MPTSTAKKSAATLRRLTKPGVDPFSRVTWARRDARITNEHGETIFEQRDVEVPEGWSQLATNVVASKYFRGRIDVPDRESSVRQLIQRVVEPIARWGREGGYFENDEEQQAFLDELCALLLEQYASFNSPVWFNVGVEEKPQCSACFILSVEDSLKSLTELQAAEINVFRYGSGAGSNLSALRAKTEHLPHGGAAAGPVAFMKAFDSWAGTIKSGGRTRRAAKMQILNCDHPDILEFVQAKRLEEQKAQALIAAGLDSGFASQGGAYDSVHFQNANFSVRVTDAFMHAVLADEQFPLRYRVTGENAGYISARELLREIALGTWSCGDPGLQFDDTINAWHTCPAAGRITASNPCSEYMHLDDSACNLASINLLKLLRPDGSIDTALLRHVASIMITAQDILVDRASYPTEKIERNAHSYRQLGLGVANLGALLMSFGLPYDSAPARSLAGALMALIGGEAYLTSSRLAARLGAFEGYAANATAMLSVISRHAQAADALVDHERHSIAGEAQRVWREALMEGRAHGFRNAQTTVIAPTGTIAFLMDCDTTGIEPDLALVKYKKLSGGGSLKIVNGSVARALKRLGYAPEQSARILNHVQEHDRIEDAPGLLPEHRGVFDCAFHAPGGSRAISVEGHLQMMAAVQPFISGAISKTVNVPEKAAVEEIEQAYIRAWQLGLKAVAIYRDNSRNSQPLSVRSTGGPGRTTRRHLPDERKALTHKFSIAGHEGYLTVGLYEDGAPGEIFIVVSKEGSTLSGIMDAFATSVSLALQYGVPLKVLVKKFTHMRFDPAGITKNPEIPFASSVMDYIFRWMGSKFLTPEEQRDLGLRPSPPPPPEEATYAAPPCPSCGSLAMIRQGGCWICHNCASTTGCS